MAATCYLSLLKQTVALEKERVHLFILPSPLVRSNAIITASIYISRQYASNFQHNNCITTSAIDGIEDIEITFTLQPNGTSHFWISFLVRLFLE